MATPSGFRNRLLLQAAITALVALTGSAGAGGWTIPTLVVAAGAVFVGLALRPEPQWRTITIAFEALAVGYGLVGLGAGHYVPGTLVAGWTLVHLLSDAGAVAFAGTPTWAPELPEAAPEPYGAEAPAPVAVPVAAAPIEVVPLEVAPVALALVPVQAAPPVEAALPEPPAVPVAPAAPRTMAAALTVLPGR